MEFGSKIKFSGGNKMINYDWYFEQPINIKVGFNFKCAICGSNLIEYSNTFKVENPIARFFVCPIEIEYGIIKWYIQASL